MRGAGERRFEQRGGGIFDAIGDTGHDYASALHGRESGGGRVREEWRSSVGVTVLPISLTYVPGPRRHEDEPTFEEQPLSWSPA